MIFTTHKAFITSAISLLSLCLISTTALAEQTTKSLPSTDQYETADASEQHDTHQHGVAKLMLLLSEEGVKIALKSPASNLFGFENAPTDGAEEAAIYEAVELLEDSDELFRMPEAAGCILDNFKVVSDIVDIHDDEHPDDDSGKRVEHSDEPANGNTNGTDQAEPEHNDVTVLWSFECKEVSELKRAEIKLFTAFPDRFNTLNVGWVSPANSNQISLDADGTVLLTQ